MFTIESFCESILEESFPKIIEQIDKESYQKFSIPKKNGNREICFLSKYSTLSKIQKKLLTSFLDKIALPECVKGFKKGENYLSFLNEHIGASFFLRLDISSFFPSINEKFIKAELSRIFVYESEKDKDLIINLICDIVTLNGSLPQGACTSPAISNIVMTRIDQRITKYCQVFGIKYTRYADDLLFSSDIFNFQEKKWFIKKIKYILSSRGLFLNYSKIKLSNNKLILNGYIINDKEVTLSRKRLSDIRHILSFSKQNLFIYKDLGIEPYLEEINKMSLIHRDLNLYPFKTMFQFIQYLCGYRSFLISFLDENLAESTFQKELKKIIRKIENLLMYFSL